MYTLFTICDIYHEMLSSMMAVTLQFITYTFVVLFLKVKDSHNNNTRINNLSFKVRYRKTSKKALRICVSGSKMWNVLILDIRLTVNVYVLKKMLRSASFVL